AWRALWPQPAAARHGSRRRRPEPRGIIERMLTIRMQPQGGATSAADAIDPAWLARDSGVTLWADLAAPTPDEGRLLRDVFHFHERAIEDALEETHHPTVDDYGAYLHVILHGIDAGALADGRFSTHDID